MNAETPERADCRYLTDSEWIQSNVTTVPPTSATLSANAERHGKPVDTRNRPLWVQRLENLLSLPHNWDTYGAPQIEPSYISWAFRLLMDIMEDDTPVPLVVPTSRGGLQLEWHTRGIDLEVEFLTPWRLEVSFEDNRRGEAWDTIITCDMSRLHEAISALSSE